MDIWILGSIWNYFYLTVNYHVCREFEDLLSSVCPLDVTQLMDRHKMIWKIICLILLLLFSFIPIRLYLKTLNNLFYFFKSKLIIRQNEFGSITCSWEGKYFAWNFFIESKIYSHGGNRKESKIRPNILNQLFLLISLHL